MSQAMIYQTFQAWQDLLNPARRVARGFSRALGDLDNMPPGFYGLRAMQAALNVFGHAEVSGTRPDFALGPVQSGNRRMEVREEVTLRTPFGTLLHFARDDDATLPRVLVVAPMSGHFATLLRSTVQVLLADHDVWITDWHNARDTPVAAGRFGFDEFVEHIMQFLRAIGPGANVVAVCQPVVAVLAAAALMAEDRDPAQPRTLTLMAGPIDTRISPTAVNQLANTKDMRWFEKTLIDTVPWRFQGGGRRVYPGAMQLTAFISMNLERHVKAHQDQYRSLIDGDSVRATMHRKFYDEYLAVMDLPAEFFLETIRSVFQEHDLPRGELMWRGNKVRPQAIRRTALLTVEGERDDICGLGQTMAALDLCTGLPTTMKQHWLQPGVGHYGVFSGQRWANSIYPRVREMIQAYS
jgi:poly(3-hydroxybutyrate) depolymerase